MSDFWHRFGTRISPSLAVCDFEGGACLGMRLGADDFGPGEFDASASFGYKNKRI